MLIYFTKETNGTAITEHVDFQRNPIKKLNVEDGRMVV